MVLKLKSWFVLPVAGFITFVQMRNFCNQDEYEDDGREHAKIKPVVRPIHCQGPGEVISPLEYPIAIGCVDVHKHNSFLNKGKWNIFTGCLIQYDRGIL